MMNSESIDRTVVPPLTSVRKIFNESGDQKEMLSSWNNKNQLENEVVERSESKKNQISLLDFPGSSVTDHSKTRENTSKTERTESQNEAVIFSSPVFYDRSSRNSSSMVSFTEKQITALEEKTYELKKYLEETSTKTSELATTGVYRKDKKSAVCLQETEQKESNDNSMTELFSLSNSPADYYSRNSSSLSVEELLQEQEYNFAQFRQQIQEQHKHQMETLLHQQMEQRKSLQEKLANQEVLLAQGPGFIKETERNHQKPLMEGNISESLKETPDTPENFHNDTSLGSNITFPVNQANSLRKQSLIEEIGSSALPPKETPIFHVPSDSVIKDLSTHPVVSQVLEDKATGVPSEFKQMPSSVAEIPPEALDPAMKSKFDHLTAAAKGFLTRLLMKSDRVQGVIQTIKDTLECALKFHQETPIKKGYVTLQDAELHKRLLTQLTAACYELHSIFFRTFYQRKNGNHCSVQKEFQRKATSQFTCRNSIKSRTCKENVFSNSQILGKEERKSRKLCYDKASKFTSWHEKFYEYQAAGG
ncbi:uncharacterized protein LOC106476563 [Limulus polyphemus]|uniref:Uncharacterized protein LOC106476563 n=1 Tax=Limulus polyphemus TaxID=6850 RepID=A0ABM1S091_LIMPO|nr:uncharacterized protein LOC106476563 [Limulus polyphemus]